MTTHLQSFKGAVDDDGLRLQVRDFARLGHRNLFPEGCDLRLDSGALEVTSKSLPHRRSISGGIAAAHSRGRLGDELV